MSAALNNINRVYNGIHALPKGSVMFETSKELLTHFDGNNDGELSMSEFSDGMTRLPDDAQERIASR